MDREMTEYYFAEETGTTCLASEDAKKPFRLGPWVLQRLDSALTTARRYWRGYQQVSQDN